MLKTISAALLAASMIAAPAFAAGTGKTAQTSTVKSEQAINGTQDNTGVKASAKTTAKAGAKTAAKTSAKSGALNANAKMRRHHHKFHKVSALKSKKTHAKIGFNGTVKSKPGNTNLSKVNLGKNKTHVSKIHANKAHSKVSFKHAAPAIKRG
jgi:hypothetical protein